MRQPAWRVWKPSLSRLLQVGHRLVPAYPACHPETLSDDSQQQSVVQMTQLDSELWSSLSSQEDVRQDPVDESSLERSSEQAAESPSNPPQAADASSLANPSGKPATASLSPERQVMGANCIMPKQPQSESQSKFATRLSTHEGVACFCLHHHHRGLSIRFIGTFAAAQAWGGLNQEHAQHWLQTEVGHL